jgi:AcrR family transcriptional regulator
MQTITGRRGSAAAVAGKGKTGRKGPGRPEGASNLRDEILDAAEELFANLGYAGTTMREVSQHAKVTQALISYYFGSKYGLFEEVFLRRGSAISDERLKNLDTLQGAGSDPSRTSDCRGVSSAYRGVANVHSRSPLPAVAGAAAH